MGLVVNVRATIVNSLERLVVYRRYCSEELLVGCDE